MTNNVRHSGIVHSVEGDCIKVRIVQTSACASCKISGRCSASESKDKIVDVYDSGNVDLNVGDDVWVVASQSTGFFAVLLSSVIPLFVLIVVLAAVLVITGNEAFAALTGLCSLIPYYIIIYMLREKIRTRLSFHIEKTFVRDDKAV